ncbi:YCR007C-like protein [Saccharomyces cerevisiae x Saccharomyces kudriavzevii VIN7]|uniref:YCR007C-like protein n=1 Tax=Saccharomyces cerevisiae x Saccharomyces kudriavzevii (strain VIN7) TaxID=1095631 RepID=H0GRU0_SACCK|nr:YCR007C-like protein [Saccharomyces cerevisiae x Saccharomyces kudriavzevii VIN7]
MQSHLRNDDVKLDTLSEPNASLIGENITLPKDSFNSYLYYLLYEMAHYKPTIVCFLVTVISILMIVVFHNILLCDIAFGLLNLSFFVYALIEFNDSVSDEEFKIKLLLEVITRKPAVKGKEWRIITYNMNQHLFDNGLWNTPYYFYCDQSCYGFFRHLIKGKNLGANSSSSANEVENTQSDAPATQPSNEVAKSYHFTFGPILEADPILEAYCLKAAEAEKQAQCEYWRKQYPDADIL